MQHRGMAHDLVELIIRERERRLMGGGLGLQRGGLDAMVLHSYLIQCPLWTTLRTHGTQQDCLRGTISGKTDAQRPRQAWKVLRRWWIFYQQATRRQR